MPVLRIITTLVAFSVGSRGQQLEKRSLLDNNFAGTSPTKYYLGFLGETKLKYAITINLV